jgi:hypothetical protein
MEPISEERQRKVYEWWLKPKGHDYIDIIGFGRPTYRVWWLPENGLSREAPTLYVLDSSGNWQPNYQWFFTEAADKLATERVGIMLEDWPVGRNRRSRECSLAAHELEERFVAADPIAALAEYVEAK